jgi:hypothetical protein
VGLKDRLNHVLARTTGHRLEPIAVRAAEPPARPAAPVTRPGDRLVEAPVFVLCSLRSGSTLLRVLLNSHPEIHAPHELHLRYMRVRLRNRLSRRSMAELGLDAEGMRYLLWDRLLHRELAASGKRLIVDKTPNNVFIADRLRACWPDARFVFLLRHPAAIARSRKALRPRVEEDANVDRIRRYCEALDRARQRHPGHTVRYEELTADPTRVTRELCAFLGVPWDPAMLDYGEHDHGEYKAGLGDWADKIRSGRVQAAAPPPAEIPEPLRPVSAAWGYLPAASEAHAPPVAG